MKWAVGNDLRLPFYRQLLGWSEEYGPKKVGFDLF
jgi:hypothetical protein